MLYGPLAWKTTLAHIIAEEMRVRLLYFRRFGRAGDMAAMRKYKEPMGFFLWMDPDAASGRDPVPALEDYYLDIMIGKGRCQVAAH